MHAFIYPYAFECTQLCKCIVRMLKDVCVSFYSFCGEFHLAKDKAHLARDQLRDFGYNYKMISTPLLLYYTHLRSTPRRDTELRKTTLDQNPIKYTLLRRPVS